MYKSEVNLSYPQYDQFFRIRDFAIIVWILT